MFGDDPDPMVMTARFGFGEVSDTGEGAMHYAKRLRLRQEGKRRTRLVSERSTKARGTRPQRADASFKNNDDNECRCNADDAMMKCKKQNKTHDGNKEH